MAKKSGSGNIPEKMPKVSRFVKANDKKASAANSSRSKSSPSKTPVQPKPPVQGGSAAKRPMPPKPPVTGKPAPKPAQRSAKPVSEKSVPQKRKKFRGGNYALYYVLGGIVAVIALIILSNTVFFRCSQISVSGNDKYTEDEIIAVSGLQTGENLLHIDGSKARDNIVDSLAYIDDAQVKKSFPTKINITVTEAEKLYCVYANGTTAAISRKGKIVELCEAGGLPVIKGYDPETLEVGKWLSSTTEGKTDIPAAIFAAAEKAGLSDITEIDMADKFTVKVTVENRVVLNLGPAEDIESKLIVAVEIIKNQLGKDEYVTLLLTNPEKVPVQNNSVPQQSRPVQSSSAASSGTSTPSSVSEPTHEPTPEPKPEPEPEPDPEPDPDPESEPEPEPEPDPKPDPDPEPDPITE